jgi:hypothetical protein
MHPPLCVNVGGRAFQEAVGSELGNEGMLRLALRLSNSKWRTSLRSSDLTICQLFDLDN